MRIFVLPRGFNPGRLKLGIELLRLGNGKVSVIAVSILAWVTESMKHDGS